MDVLITPHQFLVSQQKKKRGNNDLVLSNKVLLELLTSKQFKSKIYCLNPFLHNENIDILKYLTFVNKIGWFPQISEMVLLLFIARGLSILVLWFVACGFMHVTCLKRVPNYMFQNI